MSEAEVSQFLCVLIKMGEALQNSGAEVFRVEDTLNRIAAAYGAEEVNIFVITSSIVVTLTMPDLPPQTQTLLDTHRLRIAAKPLGIIKIDASETRVDLFLVPEPPIEPIRIIQLIQKNRNYRLAGQDRLSVSVSSETTKERVTRIREILHKLSD